MTKFILTIFAAFLLFKVGCSNAETSLHVNPNTNMNADLQNKLTAEIKRKTDAKDGSAFEMKFVNDSDWDKLYIFPPYTPTVFINKSLGFESSQLKNVDMDSREEINLLVFIKNGELKSFVEFPKRSGDFDKINRPEGFTPETARFIVNIEDRGEPWVTVTEAK